MAQLMKMRLQVSKLKLEERLERSGPNPIEKTSHQLAGGDNLLEGVMDGTLEEMYSPARAQKIEEGQSKFGRTAHYFFAGLCLALVYRGIGKSNIGLWQKKCLQQVKMLKVYKQKHHLKVQADRFFTWFALKPHEL